MVEADAALLDDRAVGEVDHGVTLAGARDFGFAADQHDGPRAVDSGVHAEDRFTDVEERGGRFERSAGEDDDLAVAPPDEQAVAIADEAERGDRVIARAFSAGTRIGASFAQSAAPSRAFTDAWVGRGRSCAIGGVGNVSPTRPGSQWSS